MLTVGSKMPLDSYPPPVMPVTCKTYQHATMFAAEAVKAARQTFKWGHPTLNGQRHSKATQSCYCRKHEVLNAELKCRPELDRADTWIPPRK